MSAPAGDPRPRRVGGTTLLATCLGAGFFPFAPATFTSLLLSIVLLLVGGAPLAVRVALVVLAVVTGTWAADRAEARYGHDARCIVIDEVAGLLLAVLFIPWDLRHLAAAFLLFRFFDIAKPPPAYQLQSLPGGWGIMADDLAAGLYTLIVLAIVGALLPFF